MPKHHASCSTQERPRMALQRPTFPSVRRTERKFLPAGYIAISWAVIMASALFALYCQT